MAFLSSHGTKNYTTIDYTNNMFLIFGKESKGLPEDIIKKHQNNLFQIPVLSPHVRSLNLANAVSIIVYEGLRNLY
jgi:tRNA (cytidine/uridine-2'-O-)-methyltransferase